MDSEQRIQLVGMALLRGLLDESRLRQALKAEGDLLAALQAHGCLDEQDLMDLGRLLPSGSGEAGPVQWEKDPVTAPRFSARAGDPWDSLPSAGEETDGSGRQVLRVLTLPAWKHYRNLRFVAEGGMGRVFKAFDSSLKRVVALKFLRRDDPELVRRFVLEAQNQAKVDHPNICKVFEVGEWQGQSYIAMQFIQGETLESAAATMSLLDKVKVMEAVAEGVHAAHRQGLIHRDLKPANIMVERGERGYKPSILDFGLARGLESTGMTLQGMVIGTIHYMAPEQARGEHESVGRRTDVYGLGATLHRVLTGQAPFPGSEGLEAVRRTLEEDVPSLNRLVPELPEDLDTIVRKCLEKDPLRRYESALAVAEDLRRWREGEPILARKPTLRYLAVKWARRNRLVVGIGAVAIVGLMITGGIAVQARINSAERARYAQQFGQEAERIEALVRYAHLQPRHELGPEMAQVRARLMALETQVREGKAVAKAPAEYALGRAWMALDEPEQARACLERARAGGVRGPDLALALGRVLGSLYQRQVELARRIPQPDLLAMRLEALDRDLRRPAIRLLEEGAPAMVATPEYQHALLAYFSGREEEAIILAKRASAQQPWLYEAAQLQGEIYLAQAQACDRSDPSRAGSMLEKAFVVLAEARLRAPSSPRTYLLEAALHIETMVLARHRGEDPERAFKAALRVLSELKSLVMEDPRMLELEAQALGIWAGSLDNLGRKDTAEKVAQQAIILAENRLRMGASVLCCRILASAWEIQALSASRRGEDPDPALENARKVLEQARTWDPADPFLSYRLGLIEARQVAFDSHWGRSPWIAFERGLKALEMVRARMPQSTHVLGSLSELWSERAEYERLHGLDPRFACAQTRILLEEPRRREPWFYRWPMNLGEAWMIEGEYLVALGQDGQRALLEALEAFTTVVTIRKDLAEPYQYLAECRIALMEQALARGESLHALAEKAREDFRQANRCTPADAPRIALMAELEMLTIRAGDSGGYARARAHLALLKRRPVSYPHGDLALAQLAYLEVRQGRVSQLEEGIESCREALTKDPKSAEAYLWLGALEALKAKVKPGQEPPPNAQAAWAKALALNANLRKKMDRIRGELGQ